jgi:hypothetical protein
MLGGGAGQVKVWPGHGSAWKYACEMVLGAAVVRNPRMDPRAGSRDQLVYIRFLIGHYTGAKPGVLSGRAFQGYGSPSPWLSQESLVCSDFIPALCGILGIGSTAHGHAAQLRPRRRSFSSTPSQPVGLDCAAVKAARKTGGSVWNAASLPCRHPPPSPWVSAFGKNYRRGARRGERVDSIQLGASPTLRDRKRQKEWLEQHSFPSAAVGAKAVRYLARVVPAWIIANGKVGRRSAVGWTRFEVALRGLRQASCAELRSRNAQNGAPNVERVDSQNQLRWPISGIVGGPTLWTVVARY